MGKSVSKTSLVTSQSLLKSVGETVSKRSVSSVTCLGVAGVAVSVTVAGLTGAEGSELWTGAAISHSALLTVLTLVTLGTGAPLHPAGRNTWPPPRRHQGDVVQVTGTWRDRFISK